MYVVYGGSAVVDDSGLLNLSTLNGVNGFKINGESPGDSGGTVCSINSANVNGDSYADLLLGASWS